jgi:hypothetical protein
MLCSLSVLLSCCAFPVVQTESSAGQTRVAGTRVVIPAELPSFLYVANEGYPGPAVDVYDRRDLTKGPVRTVTDKVIYPDGIFIDRSDNLYVANDEGSGENVVTMYAKDGRLRRIYRGLESAVDVAVGADGTVYAGDCDGRVLEYAPDSTKRIRTVPIPGCVIGVTLDAKNNLYVGYAKKYINQPCQVRRFPPKSTKGVDVLPPKTVYWIGGIGIDKNGYLLVVDQLKGVEVFSRLNEPPTRIITTGQGFPYRFTFNHDETVMYVSSPWEGTLRRRGTYGDAVRRLTSSGPKLANTVVEVTYPGGKQLNVFQFGQDDYGYPTGVAVTPTAPL